MLNIEGLRSKRIGIIIFTFIITVIIDGCLFPIVNLNPEAPAVFRGMMRLMLVAMALRYHMSIGQAEADLFPECSVVVISLLNAAMILGGLVFRYLLEFGEVSNTYNFTVFNVVFHVVVLFGTTTISYRLKRGKY